MLSGLKVFGQLSPIIKLFLLAHTSTKAIFFKENYAKNILLFDPLCLLVRNVWPTCSHNQKIISRKSCIICIINVRNVQTGAVAVIACRITSMKVHTSVSGQNLFSVTSPLGFFSFHLAPSLFPYFLSNFTRTWTPTIIYPKIHCSMPLKW